MKFKDFLTQKGIKIEDLASKTEQQLADLHNEWIEAIEKTLIEKIAQKADTSVIEAYKSQLEALNDFDPEKYKALTEEHIELMKEFKALKESGPGKKESVLQKVTGFIDGLKLEEKARKKEMGLHEMTFKAPALMTIETHIVPNVADGYSINVNNYVDSEIGHVPKPENFILPLISVETQTGTEKIWWSERNTEEGNAQFIGEGDLKPLVSAKYETKNADVKEVAMRWKMSNRMIMHTNRVVADFREHANELIDQEIDTKLLSGTGTGDELPGIESVASAFIVPAALANYYQAPNIYDVINAVAAQISLANFTPQVVVLNTVWKAKMLGIKDAEDRYLVPPFVTPDGKTISGLRVIFTNKMPADDILLGDLKKFKAVFAEDVRYYTGWENDDFSKNLTSNKLEAFLGTYIKAPHIPAIVYDNIATIQTAIGAI